jgi:hypothetical protein
MTMRIRFKLMLLVALAVMGLASCGHYNCSSGANFSSSSCTASGSGLGTGTSGGSATAYAFAVDDQNDTIDGYTLSTTAGTFAATSPYTAPVMPANFGGVGLVVAQNKFLYGVFPDLQQQELYGWSIDSTGNLTSLTGFPQAVTLTIPTLLIYNQYAVITNPAGTLLFISDAGINQIIVYQINSTTGALTPAPGSPFSAGTIVPQNMGMDGLGKYLYVSSEGSSLDHAGTVVGAFSVTSAGVLTQVAGSPFNYPLWEMQGDPTGQYLIGISGETTTYFGSDDDNLYVFSINSATGAITPVANSPFSTTGYTPFNMAVQPVATDGALIYSFNWDDIGSANFVEGYQLSTSNGALTAATGSPFTALTASAWGQFDPSGNYLFFYSGVSPSVALSAYQVTSGGGLTAIGSAVPLTTSSSYAYWAIADAQ